MNDPKIILGIESSCDETAAAVLIKEDDRVKILSNVVATSLSIQAKYGGVVPEQAAREQLKSIIPVIKEALLQAFPNVIPAKAGIQNNDLWIPDQVRDDRVDKIDAIAVTEGPGLIGSLLVGVETAKTLSLIWQKPLVPVHHLLGHFYANWINQPSASSQQSTANKLSASCELKAADSVPDFPAIGLLVSGGHTDLILMENHGKYKYLGGTRDDAAGECFDKCARLLGLPYPGGPVISKLAEKGSPQAYKLPSPMINSKNFDFSFSGLKTSVSNLIEQQGISEGWRAWGSPTECPQRLKGARTSGGGIARQDPEQIANICSSIEEAIIDVLVKKTVAAAQKYHVDQIIVAGGVAANQKLAKKLSAAVRSSIPHGEIFIPPKALCTDNAAYIAACAFYNYQPLKNSLSLQANPNLSLSH